MDLENGKQFLDASGLNLFAVLAVDRLPTSCSGPLLETGLDLGKYLSLVLIGNAGTKFWDQIQAQIQNVDHPFDTRSVALATQFAKDYLGDIRIELIYPSSLPLPLMEFGKLAGWSNPSQLGLGIHPSYGTWFAFRAIMLVAAKLPATNLKTEAESPCLNCIQKPCVEICPASATDAHNDFDVHACVDYRQQAKTQCQDRCLARIACPVGIKFQYKITQMQYHARRSLASILKYQRSS